MIDTHAHLTYEGMDTNSVIENMSIDSLSHIFTVAWDLKSSAECVALANKHKQIYAIIGFHPSDIEKLDENGLNKIKELALSEKVIAIGEIGLDYHWEKDKSEIQKEGLIKQLQLANELSLPVVFHIRDAHSDIINLLRQHKHLLNNGGVVHCFDQDYETYKIFKEEFGFKFSIGGAVTFKSSYTLQSAVSRMNIQDILLETDSPYLTPVPFRGKQQNQPKFVAHTAEKIAQLLEMDYNEFINQTTKNTLSLFKKVK